MNLLKRFKRHENVEVDSINGMARLSKHKKKLSTIEGPCGLFQIFEYEIDGRRE